MTSGALSCQLVAELITTATVVADAHSGGVSRAAAALIALGSPEAVARGGLGVVRIAEIVGGDKGQISRLLKTLDAAGLVERDEQSLVYRLGWQLYALAAQAGDRRLLDVAGPILLRLVDTVGERVNLSVLRGAEVLTVYSESPPWAIQAAGWVGRSVPAYCTSTGRALLIDVDREHLATLFADTEFDQRGLNGPADVDELYDRIRASRKRGYVVVEEEFEAALIGAAAPVRDFRGRVCAAINLSAPKFRLGARGRLTALGQAMKTAADELSLLLGDVERSDKPTSGRARR